jgi:hypothetical protein
MDVTLQLDGNLDADLRADLAQDLREVLLTLDDVEDATYVTGAGMPAGAKAGEIFTWGSLVVSLASVTSLRVVIDALASWLRRQPQDITVEVDGAKLSGVVSHGERERLVDAFVSRMRVSGGDTTS